MPPNVNPAQPAQRKDARLDAAKDALNPALERFVGTLPAEGVWGQVFMERSGQSFTLRHVTDREVQPGELERLAPGDLRKVAMFTAEGRFRPLRSAPDLRRGWTFTCHSAGEFWRAVQELYPGSIPDWFAAQSATPPITGYREFTNRQGGMYRVTQLLSDDQAATVARAACHARFCLKQRLWTAAGLAPDSTQEKSAIPCLEPCAMLLELARKAARIEQEAKLDVQLSRTELQWLLAAAESAAQNASTKDEAGQNGGTSSGWNGRGLQLLVEKFKKHIAAEAEREEEL